MSDAFAGLPEQPEARRLLTAALAAPGHAYLFAGPPGSGKRRYAERFAAELLGTTEQRVISGAHPDCVRLEPEGSGILIDQARALRRDLAMRPFEADRRIYLILDAHLLLDASANALLKSLEEPPSYGVFVLVSDHAGRMLPTIRSRLAHIAFRRFTTAQLAEVVGDADAARAALGNLGRAERLAGDPEVAERRRTYLALAHDAQEQRFDPAAAAAAFTAAAGQAGRRASARVLEGRQAELEALGGGRDGRAAERRAEERAKRVGRRAEFDELRDALDTLAWWYRDLLATSLGANDVVIHSDLSGVAEEDARVGSPGQFVQALAAVTEARRSLDLNVHPALAVEALFHRLRRTPVAQ
jgi:DNA polymerase-3 subunit delta'